MIQRLQSIFLFLASSSLGSAFALPYADTDKPVADTVFADQVFDVFDSTILLVAVGAGALVFLVSIFLYQNRKLQARMAAVGLGIAALVAGLVVGKFLKTADALSAVTVDDGPSLYTTVAAMLLAGLGIRYINKDEKLVRSADRLR